VSKVLEKISSGLSRSEGVLVFRAVRQGLMLTIPILLIGSFCLILLNLPLPSYQAFLDSQPLFGLFFKTVYDVTLGMFSLYAAAGISLCYSQAYLEKRGDLFVQGAPLAAVGAYLLFMGLGTEGFEFSLLSSRSLIVAILVGLAASALYCAFIARLRRKPRPFSGATDNVLNRALASVLPIVLIMLVAAGANTALAALFGVSCLGELLTWGLDVALPVEGSTLGGGLLYLLVNNLLWFFGVHGTSMLGGAAQAAFAPGAASAAAGGASAQVITPGFLDVFASIGGIGALLSLLLAILIFGRKRNAKKLAGLAAVPMAFNVSDLMLFGLPVIWNPALLIPFLAVPLVNLVLSYAATAVGLVPHVTAEVAPLTPPFLAGYLATGSWTGVVLQAFNVVVGMFLYLPFMRLFEKSLVHVRHREFEGLMQMFRQYELERGNVVLTTIPGTIGLLVNGLSHELRRAVKDGTFDLHYQPQFDASNRCVGAEALLRWNHPSHGMMYPPLVVKLAEETGLLEDLENAVVSRALDDALRAQELAYAGILEGDFSISVNVTARSLQNEVFVNRLIEGAAKRKLGPGRLILEATENDVLNLSEATVSLLIRLLDAGVLLAIDDFTAGNTSFKYLETSAFSMIKLDDTITQGITLNLRYADTVAAIVRLAEKLSFAVLAEYIETEEQRARFEALGCTHFQGYLYSPALPFIEMVAAVGSPEAVGAAPGAGKKAAAPGKEVAAVAPGKEAAAPDKEAIAPDKEAAPGPEKPVSGPEKAV